MCTYDEEDVNVFNFFFHISRTYCKIQLVCTDDKGCPVAEDVRKTSQLCVTMKKVIEQACGTCTILGHICASVGKWCEEYDC
jgi:hypothetical protein